MNNELRIKNKKVLGGIFFGAVFVFSGLSYFSFAYAQSRSCDLNPAGPEWTAAYKPQSGGAAYGYATAVDSAGNVYEVGEVFNAVSVVSGLDLFLRKYDSSGGLLWERMYDNNGNESAYAVASDNLGGIYVAGKEQDVSGDSVGIVRKYDSTGNLLWSQTLVGRADVLNGAAVDGTGNVYVTGYRIRAGNSSMVIMRLASVDGSLSWLNSYDDINYNESGYSVAMSPDNSSIYVAGYQSISGGDMFVQKYNSSVGWLAWTQRYNSGGNQTDIGRSVTVNAGGDVFVTGYQSTNGGDMFLRAYDPGGALKWSEVYDSGEQNNDVGRAVTVDREGRIYVAGHQNTSNGDSFLQEYAETNTPLAYSDPVIPLGPKTVCVDHFPGLIYEKNGTMARVYAAGTGMDNTDWFNNCGYSRDPGFWNVCLGGWTYNESINLCSDNVSLRDYLPGKNLLYEFDWNNVPSIFSTFTAELIYNNSSAVIATFDRNTPSNTRVAGSDASCCGGGGPQNPVVSLQINWQPVSVWRFILDKVFLYKGSSGAGDEKGYGIAINSNAELYATGYQDANGGEAFLSKYSCIAPTGGAGATSNGYFSVSPLYKYAGAQVDVDAAQSGPGISKYEWNWDYSNFPLAFIEGKVRENHIYAASGPYTIALRITYSDTTRPPQIVTQSITVYDNHQPVASFTVAPSTGSAPLVVTVNGAASDPDWTFTDPGDYVKDFIWDWGDGTPKGQGQQTTHLYNRPSPPGGYTITLTVRDSIGTFNSTSTPFTQTVTVTEQYVCAGGCGANTPICAPTNDGLATQCVQCLANTDCGSGYRCLGTPCKSGQMCPDGATECPADGRCPEAISCKAGSICPDGAACPADGICYSQNDKNSCVLSSDTQAARCYTEGMAASTLSGSCATDLDCTASLQGGTCDTTSGQCRYARCLNETDFNCASDKDCNNSDGVCYQGQCDYVYDCAYGPGMNSGATSTATTLIPAMPKMPTGIQPNGEACTKPTPDAPNNCEGINGCLYYNYNGNGAPVPGDVSNPIGNSVASCTNKFEGGTGCVYYGNQASATSSVNCLPGTDFTKLKSKTSPAGVPAGCVAIDKGSGKKEYDCSGVNNCYYYLNGTVDCDYMGGTGCIYEPSPAGATFCPRAFKTPTGGENFVQCLLNPDAILPSFLLGSNAGGLSSCSTGADCPADAPVCINGTCYPACQGNVDCVTGGQCLPSCNTSADCDGNMICDGVCQCPPGTILNTTSGLCELPINPDSFRCLDSTAVHKLDYGASPADIAVRSSQNASCRWSLLDVPFDQMIAPVGFPLDTSDLINHAASAVGFPPAGASTIFVQCNDEFGTTASCNVPLTLGDPCGTNADCRNNLVCIGGWCQAPECADAQPRGSLPYSALSDGTTISMATAGIDSNCVYSNSYDNADQCVAPILFCSTATPFATTGGQAHSSPLAGSSLVLGDNTKYAKCQETAAPQSLSGTCSIPFSVGTCNPYSVVNECDNDWVCVGVGSGPGVCEPPICSGATPTATTTLPYADVATGTDIGMTTDAVANCRYSEDSRDPYSAMTDFTNTGGQAHSTNIPVLAGANRRYVKCLGTASGEESSVCTIRFNVEGAPCDPDGYECSNGLECRNGRCAIPLCSGAYPTGRQEVGAFMPIGMNSGTVASECRFADTLIPYDSMVNVFLTLDRLTHGSDGTTQNTVQVQEGNNTKYVACRADVAPNNIDTCTIQFTGGSCRTSWDCEVGMVCGSTGVCVDDPCAAPDPPPSCIIPPPPGGPCPPLCGGGGGGGGGSVSCNTLGYEFHGSAILPSGNCDIVAIILALLSWLAWIVALLAVLSGLRAAYLYITSAGDEKKLRLAYQYLIYTTIGVGVVIISFSAVAITRAILNI